MGYIICNFTLLEIRRNVYEVALTSYHFKQTPFTFLFNSKFAFKVTTFLLAYFQKLFFAFFQL